MRASVKRIVACGLAVLGACALCLAFAGLAPVALRHVDARLYDAVLRAVAQGQVPSDTGVCIVDIDEKSLAALGAWPWPRYRLARLAEMVHAAGARGGL